MKSAGASARKPTPVPRLPIAALTVLTRLDHADDARDDANDDDDDDNGDDDDDDDDDDVFVRRLPNAVTIFID